MVIKQVIGYASAGLGLLAILFSTDKTKAKISFLDTIPGKTLLVIGIALVAVGVVFMIISGKSKSKGKQKKKEVPIYKGKEIIGYRQD